MSAARRISVCCHCPTGLPGAPVRAWIEDRAQRLRRATSVQRVVTLGLDEQRPGRWAWALEVDADDPPSPALDALVDELLADLRLLDLRPIVSVAGLSEDD